MTTIEGIVARAAFGDGQATITVFPLVAGPVPHIDPAGAIDLAIAQEAWQTADGHRAHVGHLVGRGAIIDYVSDPAPRVASMRNR